MKKLTVIGAGSSGMATAGYFALGGWDVTLCDTVQQADDFKAITRQNGILMRGISGRNGCAMPTLLTFDFEMAMENDLVIVCTSTGRHGEIISKCTPYLGERHTVLFSPGNFGSFWMQKALAEIGNHHVLTADLSGNLWACRTTGPAEVLIALPASGKKHIAAYPSVNTPKALEVLKPLLDCYPATNVLEAALNSPNFISHVIGAILNAVQIERMGSEFAFFKHGLSKVCIHCMHLLELERNALLESVGLRVYRLDSSPFMGMIMDTESHKELDLFRSLDGPSSFSHRYVSEDAACGLSMLVSIGSEYNMPVPLSKAILTLAGSINGVDYLETGHTLTRLGLHGLSIAQLAANL